MFAHDSSVSAPATYLEEVERAPLPQPIAGGLLPPMIGFPYQMVRPRPSLRVYSALCDAGLKPVIDEVLQQKNRMNVTTNHIYNALISFLVPSEQPLICDLFKMVLQDVSAHFMTRQKVPILSLDSAALKIQLDKSPGLPWIQASVGLQVSDVMTTNMQDIQDYWSCIAAKLECHPLPDCAAFARSHIDAPGRRTVTPVWVYPLTALIAECQFGHEFMQCVLRQEIAQSTGYGMEMCKGGMQWLNNKLRMNSDCKFVVINYKNFDADVPAWLIQNAFTILGNCIDFSVEKQRNGEFKQVDAFMQLRKWEKLVDYFINTPVRLSDGTRIQTRKGIPSGSYFADLVGTMCNMLVSRFLAKLVFDATPRFDIYFRNEAVLALPAALNVDLRLLNEMCGFAFKMTINLNESYWTADSQFVKFLGFYNWNGCPVKPRDELIATLVYPEIPSDDWLYCIFNAICCLVDAGGADKLLFDCLQAVIRTAMREPGADALRREIIRCSPHAEWFLDTQVFNIHPLLVQPKLDCTKILKNI